MRRRLTAMVIAATATVVLALAGATTTALARKHTTKGKKIRCHITLHTQRQATQSSPGEDFGFVRCSGPFGRGVQHDTYTLTPKTSTTGTAVLHFKAYFDDGTVSGVWHATYEFTSQTTGTFIQKVRWTSGTGAFSHVRGHGPSTGTQNGSVGTVDQTITVTGA